MKIFLNVLTIYLFDLLITMFIGLYSSIYINNILNITPIHICKTIMMYIHKYITCIDISHLEYDAYHIFIIRI